MDTKAVIIQEALKIFNTKGYERTNISDIMEATNLSKGGMYHHFKSKEMILIAVINYAYSLSEKVFQKEFNSMDGLVNKMILLMKNDIVNENEYLLSFSNLIQQDSIVLKYYLDCINQNKVIPYLINILDEGSMTKDIISSNIEYDSKLLYHLCNQIVQKNKQVTLEDIDGFLNVFIRVFSPSVNIIIELRNFFYQEYLNNESI